MASLVDTTKQHLRGNFAAPVKMDKPAMKTQAARQNRQDVLVPARLGDVPAVHSMVIDAIQTSPYYNSEFKSYESGRLTPAYLAALLRVDPRHLMTIRDGGALAGFILSGPEFGVLWQYWSYLDPKHRSGTLAMRVMRNYQSVWENDRFHKILTYSRPDNKVSIALMERYGYKLVADLKQHMFGEDYLLYEYALNKSKPGYDTGVSAGRLAKLRYRLGRMLPFLSE